MVLSLPRASAQCVRGVFGRAFAQRFQSAIGGRVRPRRPDISLVWFGVVSTASEASDQGVWGVYGSMAW
jgi:hypothetical protein